MMERNVRIMEQYDYLCAFVKKRAVGAGLSADDEADLLQIVVTECLEAYERYDDTKGMELRTFLHEVANFRCQEWFERRENAVIPLSEWQGRQWQMAKRARNRVSQRLLREPTNSEVAAEMGLTIDEYELLRTKYEYEQISLEDMADGLDDTACLGEAFIGGEEMLDGSAIIPDPVSLLVQNEAVQELRKQLDGLLEQERAALTMRFGIEGGEPLAQSEVAAALDVSQPTVSRLIDSGVRKLRARLELKGIEFEDFLTNAMRDSA